MTEGDIYWSLRGREYRLGPPVKGAGRGIYSLPLSREIVARIHPEGADLEFRERKIEAMLKRPPALPDLVEDGVHFVRMDWPVASLHDRSRAYVGFLMPAVDLQSTSPLESVLQERQARAEGLPTSLGAKINLAARLAVAITELHQQEHRIVHLTPANLRFHRQSLHLALVGCERFSISASLERFVPDPGAGGVAFHYVAPEFQDQPIPPGKEESQDRFALAVLIFQLLNFGIHPYTGKPTRDDVPDDIPGRIARNCYAYGATPHPDLAPSPGSGHEALPMELRTLFDRAFASDGRPRPPAQEWSTWLQFYSIPANNCVVACVANARHHHFADLPCAACARAPLVPGTNNDPDIPPQQIPVDPVQAIEPPFVPAERAFPPANRFPAAKRPAKPTSRWDVLRRLSAPQLFVFLAIPVLVIGSGIDFVVSQLKSKATDHASVPQMAEAPTAPAQAPDPYLTGNPALQQSEAMTRGYVMAAARAIATDERTEWQRAITNLHTDAPQHPPVPMSEFQAPFTGFSASLSSDHFDEGKRQWLLKQLRQALRSNPFDDESAYELGWLSLVGGRRDEARNFFLHAIWVNPDRADAWYGMGVIGGDDTLKTGALTTAELLNPDPANAQSMRNAFPPLLLQLASVKPEHFARLEKKARQLAEHYRPLIASPKYE